MTEHAANGIEPSQKEEENQVIVCSNTMAGLRDNLHVAAAYTAVRLSGNGAVAIHNLMEDAATAEISRAQVWQQIKNGTVLADTGEKVTKDLVARTLDEEVERLPIARIACSGTQFRPRRALPGGGDLTACTRARPERNLLSG